MLLRALLVDGALSYDVVGLRHGNSSLAALRRSCGRGKLFFRCFVLTSNIILPSSANKEQPNFPRQGPLLWHVNLAVYSLALLLSNSSG